jgi:hypothetical protein
VVEFSESADGILLVAKHGAYPGIAVRRAIEWSAATSEWSVTDEVQGAARAVDVEWRLHADVPLVEIAITEDVCRLSAGPTKVEIVHPVELRATLERAPSSEAYGSAAARPVVVLMGKRMLPLRISYRFSQTLDAPVSG